MKKLFTFIVASLAIGIAASAQNSGRISVQNITADSLSKVILKESGRDLLIRDLGETLFSLDCSRQTLWSSLEVELENKGFRLLDINNYLVAVSSKELLTKLPERYFETNPADTSGKEYVKAVTFDENTAKSENKVYKIGDPNMPAKGNRVLMSGYVKNLDSGEPLPGVSVMLEEPYAVATTDAFGLYRLTS